jgi:hypothetical protein
VAGARSPETERIVGCARAKLLVACDVVVQPMRRWKFVAMLVSEGASYKISGTYQTSQ